jgi:sensor c-di-GMP phosphodiesterase-like protein
MQTMNQRALLALTATLVAGTVGALTGYLIGRVATVSLAQQRLELNAAEAAKQADRSLAESQAVLAAMHASPYTACDDQELTYFRALLFESRHLKDVGRVVNDDLACSGALGRLARPKTMPKPDFQLQDGTRVYKSLPLYQDVETNLVALQQEDSYIVLRPDVARLPGSKAIHFAETVVDAPSQKVRLLQGDALNLSPTPDLNLLAGDGLIRVGETLYATRCSTRGLSCVIAFASIPEILGTERLPMAIYCGFGGVTGALLGLLISIFHRRSKGIEQQLRRAVQTDALKLMYQPIVDLATRRILGAEALARWTDEDGFEVGPDVFVRIAERRGMLPEFTNLVLRNALKEMGVALRTHAGFRLNINVTSTDLSDPRFLQMLEQTLLEAGVSPRSIGIEIAESGTAQQRLAIDAIFQLRRRGHRVYIDNFGTGYSNFAYLQDLGVDAIKIDRRFTKAIGTGAVTEANLPKILALAKALDLEVVVEGIENREQANYFLGTDRHIHAQGWLFGYPFSAEEFEKLLADDSQKEKASSGQPGHGVVTEFKAPK